jgi:hypothetical protein
MAAGAFDEIVAFRSFIDEQIALGRSDLTPEESLLLWRAQRAELDDDVIAVERALAYVDSGGTCVPLRDFINEFRRRKSVSPDA